MAFTVTPDKLTSSNKAMSQAVNRVLNEPKFMVSHMDGHHFHGAFAAICNCVGCQIT